MHQIMAFPESLDQFWRGDFGDVIWRPFESVSPTTVICGTVEPNSWPLESEDLNI